MAHEATVMSAVKNSPGQMRITAVQSQKKEEKPEDEGEAENEPKEQDD